MFKSTTEYHEWGELPYETQLRLVRALAKIAIDCANLTVDTVYLQSGNGQKFNINSIYESVDFEIVTHMKGKD
jgi:hypothetical protein